MGCVDVCESSSVLFHDKTVDLISPWPSVVTDDLATCMWATH